MKESPLPFLVAVVLIVGVLSMFLVSSSWVIALPILLALATVAYLGGTVRR